MPHRGLALALPAEHGDAAAHVLKEPVQGIGVCLAAHALLEPEVAGLQDIVLILLGDDVGVGVPGPHEAAPELIQQPADGVFRIDGGGPELGGLGADDDLPLVHADGDMLADVVEVLRPLEDAGELRMLQVELGDEFIAGDADLRLRIAVFCAHFRHALGDGLQRIHSPLLISDSCQTADRASAPRIAGSLHSISLPQSCGGRKEPLTHGSCKFLIFSFTT